MDLDYIVSLLENRPKMIIGAGGINELYYLVTGYILGRSGTNLETSFEKGFAETFNAFISEYYHCNSTQSWADKIEYFEGRENSIAAFIAHYKSVKVAVERQWFSEKNTME